MAGNVETATSNTIPLLLHTTACQALTYYVTLLLYYHVTMLLCYYVIILLCYVTIRVFS